MRPPLSWLEGRGERNWERDHLHYSWLLGSQPQGEELGLLFVCCLSRLIALSIEGKLCFMPDLCTGWAWDKDSSGIIILPVLLSLSSLITEGTDSSLKWSNLNKIQPSFLKFCKLGFDCSFLPTHQVLVEGYQSQGSVGFASWFCQEKCYCNYSCSALVLLTPCPCLLP